MAVKGAGPPPSAAVEEWPHRPAYFCAHPDVHTKDHEAGAPLPLNEFVEFETKLFVGKMLCRLKPILPTQEKEEEKEANSIGTTKIQSHDEYFKNKNRHYQFVIQGHFRKEIPLSDIVMGDYYERPFLGIPRGPIMRLYQKFMETVSPGVVMDMTSETPKILAAFGSAQTLQVDIPGEEPDLSQPAILNGLKDNTKLLFGEQLGPKKGIETSPAKRRTYLSKSKNSSKYKTNPDHVYTVELYDHTMCFGSYYHHAMGIKADMAKTMNAQPLAFGIFTKHDQEVVCKFPVWHERLLDEMKVEQK